MDIPSLFMPVCTHLRSRQALHWLRCVLSTTQLPSALALHTYCRCLLMDRLKNPAQLRQVETMPLHTQVETVTKQMQTVSGWYLPIAGKDSVVFPRRMVLTHFAWDVVEYST